MKLTPGQLARIRREAGNDSAAQFKKEWNSLSESDQQELAVQVLPELTVTA